jgi:predicted amidophosphoribosyltransferase
MTTSCNYKRLSKSTQGAHSQYHSGWSMCTHRHVDSCSHQSYQRSSIGQLVYDMKYNQSLQALHELSLLMSDFINRRLAHFNMSPDYFAAIIPIQPTIQRQVQPVTELARSVAAIVGIPCDTRIITKEGNHSPMKNIQGYGVKRSILNDVLRVADRRYDGKRVLLIDDIIDSGATFDATAEVLKRDGGVSTVHVLCATHTFTQQ